MKLATNLYLVTTVTALAESAHLARVPVSMAPAPCPPE